MEAVHKYEQAHAEAKSKGLRVKALLLCSHHITLSVGSVHYPYVTRSFTPNFFRTLLAIPKTS